MHLLATLREFLGRGGQRLLVAFSGGPDSTGLLWGLRRIADEMSLEIFAAHLDHGLDADSGRRAREARRLAAELDVRYFSHRLEARPPGRESLEAWARDRRYGFLRGLAGELAVDRLLTAHHADDQAETVLLRLLYGSGLEGLAGIRKRRGRLSRPLLDLRRSQILEYLEAPDLSGRILEPVVDPTNALPDAPRNHVRHHLIPALEARDPRIVDRLCSLARAAARASRRWEVLLASRLGLRPAPDAPSGAELERRELELLPEPLWTLALAALGRRAGVAYPAGEPARRELRRQLLSRSRIGCDCGRGWRWEGDRETLRLLATAAPKPKPSNFAYTLPVPGEVKIPELALRVRIRRGEVAPWMFCGRVDRAGLSLTPNSDHQVSIRNRRPGDRLQPLGGSELLRLKDLLIARRIPRQQRDRIPLMIIDGMIAWVPGVTIDERFRLSGEKTAWIAEIEPINDEDVESRSDDSLER